MPTRQEKIDAIMARQKKGEPSREEKIEAILARQSERPNVEEMPPLHALGRGFVQEATFDYGPEAMAGKRLVERKMAEAGAPARLEAFAHPVLGLISALRGPGEEERLEREGVTEKPTYEEMVKTEQEAMKEAERQHPGTMMGGRILGAAPSGGIIGGLLKGARLARTGTKLGRMATAGQAGFVSEAARRAPEEEVGLKGRFQRGLIGAGLGAGGQSVAEVAGMTAKALKRAPKAMQEAAEARAFKATGGMLKDFRRAAKQRKLHSIGRTVLDENLIQVGDTVEDISKKSKILLTRSGKKIGQIYDQVQAKLDDPNFINKLSPELADKLTEGINPEHMTIKIMKALDNELGARPDAPEIIKRVEPYLRRLFAKGEKMTIKDAIKWKGFFDEQINYNKMINEAPGVQQAYFSARNTIRNYINENVDAVAKAVKGDLGKQLRAQNKRYGNLSEIYAMSSDRALRESANAMFGLRDAIMAGGGLGGGAAYGAVTEGDIEGALKWGALGAAAGLGSKIARKYGQPALTKTMDLTSRGLQTFPGRVLTAPASIPLSVVEGLTDLAKKDPVLYQQILQAMSQEGEPPRQEPPLMEAAPEGPQSQLMPEPAKTGPDPELVSNLSNLAQTNPEQYQQLVQRVMGAQDKEMADMAMMTEMQSKLGKGQRSA